MSELREKFLEQTIDCFGDDIEKKHVARSLLDRYLSKDDRAFETAGKSMLAAAERPRWRLYVIYAFMLLAGLFIVFFPVKRVYEMSGILGANTFLGMPLPSREYEPWEFYFDDLSETDRLLLFGDTSRPDESERREAFWNAEPDNMGAYIEYAVVHRLDYGFFPKDMLDVAGEKDPDNALFFLLYAGEIAGQSTKKIYPGRTSSGSRRSARAKKSASALASPATPTTRTYVEITDVEKHREALEMLHKAAKLPECTGYEVEMMKRRLPLLDKKDYDWITRMLPVVWLSSHPSYAILLINLSKLVQAEAYRCEQEKDRVALERLMQDWKSICRHIHASSQTLMDALVLRAIIHAPMKDFSIAAKACDLPELEKHYADLDKRLTDERDARSRVAKTKNWDEELMLRGGTLTSMTLPVLHRQVNDDSSIPMPDLRPERLADHAFWNRIMSAVQWLLLLVMALTAWIYSRCGNSLVRKVCHRLAGSFTLRDWVFVVCLGILFPVAIYWLLNGAETVLSVQNWSLVYAEMVLPSGQSGSLLLLLCIAPMLAIAHRINRVIPLTECKTPWLIWAAAISALLSMPVFGWAAETQNFDDLIYLGFGLQGVAVLMLLAMPIVDFIRRQRDGELSLASKIRQNLLVPAYLAAALVMALQVPAYHAIEKHWVAKDEIFELSPDHTSFTRIETLVTIQLLRELETLLDEIDAK